jgi:hypothetical protein
VLPTTAMIDACAGASTSLIESKAVPVLLLDTCIPTQMTMPLQQNVYLQVTVSSLNGSIELRSFLATTGSTQPTTLHCKIVSGIATSAMSLTKKQQSHHIKVGLRARWTSIFTTQAWELLQFSTGNAFLGKICYEPLGCSTGYIFPPQALDAVMHLSGACGRSTGPATPKQIDSLTSLYSVGHTIGSMWSSSPSVQVDTATSHRNFLNASSSMVWHVGSVQRVAAHIANACTLGQHVEYPPSRSSLGSTYCIEWRRARQVQSCQR